MQAILAKLAITLALDKRTWKIVAVLIAAIFLPIILLILALGSLFGGLESGISGADSAVYDDENDEYILSEEIDGEDEFSIFVRNNLLKIEKKYRVENVSENEVETEIENVSETKIESVSETEIENTTPDKAYVKAVFLYISAELTEEHCKKFNVSDFLNCFENNDNPLPEIEKLYAEIKFNSDSESEIEAIKNEYFGG